MRFVSIILFSTYFLFAQVVWAAPSPRRVKPTKKVSYCFGGVFKPCVCWKSVPVDVKYKPSDPLCPRSRYPGDTKKHVASIILSGSYYYSFSSVVRTNLNADRSPYEAALCSQAEYELGLNKCSRWKVWKEYRGKKSKRLCLGASGYSKVFSRIQRITIKMSDRAGPDGQKDIRRLCLKSPRLSLN